MTLDEMQQKYNKLMKIRRRNAIKLGKSGNIFNLHTYNDFIIVKGQGRAIKNQGTRKPLVTGYQLKIGRI